jgi:hypothetical protein
VYTSLTSHFISLPDLDFDVSLRLQTGGYITRWATYSAGGFKEGVSLTINDEM